MISRVKNPQLIHKWNEEHPNSKVGSIVDDRYFNFRRDLVKFPNDVIGTFYVLSNPYNREILGTYVIPFYRNQVVMIKNYRYPLQEFRTEFIGGYSEGKEGFVETVIREVWEEVGGRVQSVIDLGILHKDPSRSCETVKLCVVELGEIMGVQDRQEGIAKVGLFNMEEVNKIILEEGNIPMMALWLKFMHWYNTVNVKQVASRY